MTTEYEQMLAKMVEEKKAKATALRGKKGKDKELASVVSDIRFLEVELQRYGQGMSLFRSKGLPKVGRWGKAESEGSHAEQ